ncbi:SPASM domain-containing protein [Streptomyces sp. CA-288835]|uniref:SPASM domain-containing protein n=1 Tax=Streptomyces sp. CA-288835 TaxID=3240069 RepID=UPI003D8C6732
MPKPSPGPSTSTGAAVALGALGDGRRARPPRKGECDHVRPFGRGAHAQAPDTAALCGQCGSGRAAIGPNGDVAPCVFSRWMDVGNIRDAPLASILGGDAMTQANAIIRSTPRMAGCEPGCEPNSACNPGTPPSDCNPRR